MPFIYDFNNTPDKIHTVVVNPKGWNGPVTIEYVSCQAHEYDPVTSIAWRVKGTSHTFTIGEQRLNVLCDGNSYKKHFEEVLEKFRVDYLRWFKEEEYAAADWKFEYQREYGDLIRTEE